MASAGVKGGQVIGEIDDLGLNAVNQRLHAQDMHETLLWSLGLDRTQLSYRHHVRPERPSSKEGAPRCGAIPQMRSRRDILTDS